MLVMDFFMPKNNKKPLNQVDRKIDLSDYSTEEYSDFLDGFEDTIIKIKYKDDNDVESIINVKLDSNQLAHLLGFQYAYDEESNKKFYKGKLAINTLRNISFSDIKYNINRNNISYNTRRLTWDYDIKPRFEYLPYALNTICSKYSLRMQKEKEEDRVVKTLLKGKYFYYKSDDKHYLIFSIVEASGSYYFESFIVNDGLKILGVLDEYEVVEVTTETIQK